MKPSDFSFWLYFDLRNCTFSCIVSHLGLILTCRIILEKLYIRFLKGNDTLWCTAVKKNPQRSFRLKAALALIAVLLREGGWTGWPGDLQTSLPNDFSMTLWAWLIQSYTTDHLSNLFMRPAPFLSWTRSQYLRFSWLFCVSLSSFNNSPGHGLCLYLHL